MDEDKSMKSEKPISDNSQMPTEKAKSDDSSMPTRSVKDHDSSLWGSRKFANMYGEEPPAQFGAQP